MTPGSLKATARRTAEVVAARAAPLLWKARRETLTILMYHRILPRNDARLLDEQPGMIVHPETLQLHVQALKRHFTLVKLDDWIASANAGEKLPDRACAITFDDGWRDNFDHAFPILLQEQAPATVFLVSDLVGTTYTFWPERLGTLLRRGLAQHGAGVFATPSFAWLHELGVPLPESAGEMNADVLDRIVVQTKRHADRTIEDRLNAMESLVGGDENTADRALMDWDQIGEMLASGLITVGSHTRRHTRLNADVTPERLHDEIVNSKILIEKKCGRSINLFCYPNGDTSPAARELVANHYAAACSTVNGWHVHGRDPHMLRRVAVHQDVAYDEVSFLARVSGWF